MKVLRKKKAAAAALRAAAVLLFILLMAFFYRTAAYSLRPDDEGVRTRLEGFYGEEENSLDVVFVGSSAVYSVFSPMRLWADTGIASYLYATPNQTVPMIRYILEECRKTQPDALYVIELRPMLASEEDKKNIAVDLRRLTDNMPYSLTRFWLIRKLASPQEQLSCQLDLVKYHDNWKQWNRSDLTFSWGSPNPLKGWNFVSVCEPIEERNWRHVNARIPVSEENEADLRALLDYCTDEGIRAVFVTTPFALSRAQAKQYNYTGDIVAEYGFEFWNMCRYVDEIGLNFGTDYYDFRHTNTLGAIKCTEWLGQRLSEYMIQEKIPMGRMSESCLADWEACLMQYEQAEAESAELIRQKIREGRWGE